MSFLESFFGGPPQGQGMGRMGYGGFGNPGRITDWSNSLRAYPSFSFERQDIDKGNKIILPSSVLYEIQNYNLPQPMIFKLTTYDRKRTIHCGVEEFVAPEESMILPFWMFRWLQIMEGAMLIVQLNPALPKGTYLKIQPHETAFTEMADPKGYLDYVLRDFQCVDKGITIETKKEFGDGKPFAFNIVDIKPQSQFNSICLVDTNIILDFDVPLDYQEPSPTKIKRDRRDKMKMDEEMLEEKED